jgi:hypothetical protein
MSGRNCGSMLPDPNVAIKRQVAKEADRALYLQNRPAAERADPRPKELASSRFFKKRENVRVSR